MRKISPRDTSKNLLVVAQKIQSSLSFRPMQERILLKSIKICAYVDIATLVTKVLA